MPKRRVIIPELVTMANKLQSKANIQKVKSTMIKSKQDIVDKTAKFKFLCGGDANGS
jgi:hypothetical protein